MRRTKVEILTGDAAKHLIVPERLLNHLKQYGLKECSEPCCGVGEEAAKLVAAGILVEGVDWDDPVIEDDDDDEEEV